MSKSQFKLKAAALQTLSDLGLLFKEPEPHPARDRDLANRYRSDLIARAYNQYNASNPDFFVKLRDRIQRMMEVDHQWEMQLGGPDDPSNFHILDTKINGAFGRQIRKQIRGLPDYTPIRIIIVGPS